MSLLDVEGLTVAFSGLTAVDAVDITVEQGSLVGLIGPNGAGKTTFIDAVTGFVPAAGTVRFDGTRIDGLPPHRRAALGMGRTWQSVQLFEQLSVVENLLVAADRPRWHTPLLDLVRPRRKQDRRRVEWALDVLAIEELADRMPDELTQGEKKVVGVARALAGGARLVLLDEPAAGLDADASLRLGHRLRQVVDHGVTVLLVDHDMGLVLGVCDNIYVLEFGRVIARGTPEQVRDNGAVIAAYLGVGTAT